MIAPLIAATLAASVTVAPAPAVKAKPCKDPVVAWIKEAGFKGANVRVAWNDGSCWSCGASCCC